MVVSWTSWATALSVPLSSLGVVHQDASDVHRSSPQPFPGMLLYAVRASKTPDGGTLPVDVEDQTVRCLPLGRPGGRLTEACVWTAAGVFPSGWASTWEWRWASAARLSATAVAPPTVIRKAASFTASGSRRRLLGDPEGCFFHRIWHCWLAVERVMHLLRQVAKFSFAPRDVTRPRLTSHRGRRACTSGSNQGLVAHG